MSHETETPSRTYKIAEAGKLLGIGRNQAYEAARRGDLPVIRLGKRLLVSKAALDRMLDEGTTAHARIRTA